MKKKNGFTLIEVLAAIVIIALLIGIAIPSYNFISKKIKERSYDNKVSYVLSKAENWANDTDNMVTNIGHLIDEGYLEADNYKAEFKNPIDNSDMRCLVVRISSVNNQFEARLTGESVCDFDQIMKDNAMIELVQVQDDGTINPSNTWTKKNITLKVQFKDANMERELRNYITEVSWNGNGHYSTTIIDSTHSFASSNTLSLNVEQILNHSYEASIKVVKGNETKVYTASTIVKIDKQKPIVYSEDPNLENWENLYNKINLIASDSNGSGVYGYLAKPNGTSCPKNFNEYTKGDSFVQNMTPNQDRYLVCSIDNVGNVSENKTILTIQFVDYSETTQSIRGKYIFASDNRKVMITSPSIQKYFGHRAKGWTSNKDGFDVEKKQQSSFTINAPITYYALYEKDLYVLYDGNGYGINISPTMFLTTFNSYGKTKQVQVKISDTKPSRKGYRFLGWSKDKNGPATYQPGDIIDGVNKGFTLYAQWEQIKHEVTYDCNGGTGCPSKKTIAEGDSIPLDGSGSKSCGKFLGWNTSKDATSGITSLTMGTSNVTLFAIYQKCHTVTYNYWYNSNNVTSNGPEAQKVSEGSQIDINPNSKKAAKEDWTFVGWNTNKDATTAAASVTMRNTDVTLYAIYKKNINVTFVYHTFDGNYSTRKTESKKKTIYNNTENVSVSYPNPSYKNCYGYWNNEGWTTNEDAKLGISEDDDISSDTTLYALYSYELSFRYDFNIDESIDEKGNYIYDKNANYNNICIANNDYYFYMLNSSLHSGKDYRTVSHRNVWKDPITGFKSCEAEPYHTKTIECNITKLDPSGNRYKFLGWEITDNDDLSFNHYNPSGNSSYYLLRGNEIGYKCKSVMISARWGYFDN